jgi:serine/threonine protein kinase
LPETFGSYVVHEELGSGGMAIVHRAELPGIEGFSKEVALKRMLPQLAMHKSVVEAFVREGRLASMLHHANIAQTFELGKVDDTYFIAMELVTGRHLGDIQRRAYELGGPLPLELTLNILNQLCDALEYAHDLCDESGEPLGIIHRDVSPVNIIVADSGVVKLIDFGIAKAEAAGLKTRTFSVKGKFAYMAPEYAFHNKIDSRADIFAAAVIAYEMMVGRSLFTGNDDMDTMLRLRTLEIPPLTAVNPKIPAEIEHIVMTGLARNPEERWQRASAMREALATVTKRLGLVRTNTHVVQALTELFARPLPPPRPTPMPVPMPTPTATPRPDATPIPRADPTPTPRPAAILTQDPAPAPPKSHVALWIALGALLVACATGVGVYLATAP